MQDALFKGKYLNSAVSQKSLLTNERTLKRKANEAYMAVLLDYNYSKERILELYLNEVFLGQNGNDEIRGFPLASLLLWSSNQRTKF